MTLPRELLVTWAGPYAPPVVHLGEIALPEGRRVTIDCAPGSPPSVYVEYDTVPPEVLEMTGLVHIVREVPADPFKAVLDFLGNIDDEALTAAVLEDDTLAGKPFGAAALEVLTRWARGD